MHTETSLLQLEETKHAQDAEGGHGSLEAIIEALRHDVANGFLDTHSRLHKNAAKILETASFCYALVELLEEKGLLSFQELNERQQVVSKRLLQKFEEKGIGVMAVQNYKDDKYAFSEEVEIDCASRVPVCRAACCRLHFALSQQDIKEGIVRWDLGEPYMIAHDADGYCTHHDRATGQCTVWQQRPIPCRGYDCRKDDRIWLDFDNHVISPELDALFHQPADLEP